MRSRNVLAALALFVCFFGCRSEKNATLPDELVGVWKTSAPGYEENLLELRKNEIRFGSGKSNFVADAIFDVERVHEAGEKAPLIKIHHTDAAGHDLESSLYYDPSGGGSIRFKNQMRIEWKLVRRVADGSGSFSQSASSGLWRRRFNLNVAMALLGVPLVACGMVWRLKESKVRRARRASGSQVGSALDAESRPRPVAAAQMGGNGEASRPLIEKEGVDWSQVPTSLPTIAAQTHRRSERILLTIPVQVAGTDVGGNSFEEGTFTLYINRNGAFLCLRNSVQPGDRVTVTNVGTRQASPFRVCESGGLLADGLTAWGVESLEPDPNFWQVYFPERPPESSSSQKNINALVECAVCQSRELMELSVPQFREMLETDSIMRECSKCRAATEWKFKFIEPSGEGTYSATMESDTSVACAQTREENRCEKRILVILPIRLRRPADGQVENTSTENVSKSGVCCAASMELKVGELVFVTFESGGKTSDKECPARTMWRRPMGEKRRTLYGMKLEVEEF